jgi:hypothetical protein
MCPAAISARKITGRLEVRLRVFQPQESVLPARPKRDRTRSAEAGVRLAENADAPNPASLISEHDLIGDHLRDSLYGTPAGKNRKAHGVGDASDAVG